MIRTLTLLFIIIAGHNVYAQETGGRYTFQFLSLPNSARITSLAGSLITVQDDDVTLGYVNPAALNPLNHGHVSVSHQFHFADIQHTYAAYGHHLKKWGINSHFGIHHFDYGQFNYGNEIGQQEGSFGAAETAFVLGASKIIENKLSVGVNLKNVFSSFESYNAYGLAADIGAIYKLDSAHTAIGLVIRNIGGEITSFNSENKIAPLDIQIAYSKKLKYLPFRFSVIFQNLQRWGVRYDDPDKAQNTNLFGEEEEQTSFQVGLDNFFRHFALNGEFLLGKSQNLRIRGGYNHLRRKELSLQSLRSLAGFSMGLGIKISYFKLDYGIAYHHVAGATHHLSLGANIFRFKKL